MSEGWARFTKVYVVGQTTQLARRLLWHAATPSPDVASVKLASLIVSAITARYDGDAGIFHKGAAYSRPRLTGKTRFRSRAITPSHQTISDKRR